jgi:hypothetical protein
MTGRVADVAGGQSGLARGSRGAGGQSNLAGGSRGDGDQRGLAVRGLGG